MRRQIDDDWYGWNGETVIKLTDSSLWRQEEYHYEFHYSYQPQVTLVGNLMHVDGMSRAVRVRKLN